jgi:diketogulonate reductase-like aldo/keto reductase
MSDYGYEHTFRAFDLSLRNLGLDVLDLYLIHWPLPSAFEATVASYRAMTELLSQGRVRAIGVSNFTGENLEVLIEQTGHVPAVNQVELHPFFNQEKLRKVHERLGIVTQAWSPIGGVQRYGAKARASKEVHDVLSHPVVVKLSQKYKKSSAQIILRWQLHLGNSPIPKSVRPTRIVENIDVFDFDLAPDEIESISGLEAGERGGWDPDQVNLQTFAKT